MGTIESIETNTRGTDTVDITDPLDTPEIEPGPGHDIEPWIPSAASAPAHVDPLGTALTHLGVGHTRELDRHGSVEDAQRLDESFAEFGSEERPERWVHDQALQVAQLMPTGFGVNQYVLTTVAPVKIAEQRRERLTLVLQNFGANTIYVGPNIGSAVPGIGWPIIAGGLFSTDVMCELYASVVAGAPSVLATWDQFRTDNKGS